ncbi:MAG: hypothetical protein OIN87_00595 [Candidatus Methanoperedens sp.]|nr:hypothetical protein [Candidatus Methanoperedens sp.]
MFTDKINYFSLSKPDNWNVNVGEFITIEDASDNGITNVRIQPIHLSGKFRYISARDIANYLIGKEKQKYTRFELFNVKESEDKKIIELEIEFKENGVDKKGVYTIFVNSPYAMLSGYETRSDKFDEKKQLLNTILLSYQQNTPSTTEGSGSNIGELSERNLDKSVKMLLPDRWNTVVFPGCSGLIAFDGELSNNKKGVVFMNGLHQSIEPLPSGVTPEAYVTTYMKNDFKTMSDIKILHYEDIDLSALRAGGANVQAIRISFKNNGIPSIGSFTINTYGTAYSSAVGYIWGIFSTENEIYADALPLLKMFNSIDYSESTLTECRNVLSNSWKNANEIGDSIRESGEQSRSENLRSWQERQKNNDAFLDKFSDAILDRDKVYNPDKDEVYEVDANFYQYYDIHREKFEYQNMRELTQEERLNYIPLNGDLNIK